ncbi:pyruvate dehydrogenase (acetyl-transferring) E1 component subunit alpha [Agrilutibacter solisilvae]|uniref:Pyruvate dehydrogenase E1 component subunit alpha n=1 Tax=Agrilutibacter solisilvae TaxID=2763317 RepID=A0A974Y1G7_9GAMM|nr:pyruvate dehydrogenase (acetyl-transferring) E1 component subunit alpha [Lysobacter solisilvae]QSX79589.1 pyruvate dehydrogenase (acetyl-transferring) E1 component subunit alpha [Lysobacter solisilvae]
MTIAARYEIEHLQYLGADGALVAEPPADLADPKALLPLFKQMLFVRVFDTKAIALQRTGKLGTYASCLGHEATHVGIGASMRPEDVFAPSYREYGAQFMRGVQPREVLLYWGGDERGNDFAGPKHDYPWCVPISTQCLMAAGAALAFKLRKEDRIAVACCGDGGSSKTDFYAALNSAGAYTSPLVLCVINNGWAISVPRSAQTGATTLAQKGLAGGLHCLQVDGNDLIAVLEGMRRATQRARNGEGGTVIEFLTYRLHDHTTADDARRYRGEEEVKSAWGRDPIPRLRAYLTAKGAWSEAEEKSWAEDCGKRVDEEINAYLNTPVQPVEAMFDYLYADMPPDVQAHRAAALALEGRS